MDIQQKARAWDALKLCTANATRDSNTTETDKKSAFLLLGMLMNVEIEIEKIDSEK
jgi:hypothetical protein